VLYPYALFGNPTEDSTCAVVIDRDLYYLTGPDFTVLMDPGNSRQRDVHPFDIDRLSRNIPKLREFRDELMSLVNGVSHE
jgi:hypothetical protein